MSEPNADNLDASGASESNPFEAPTTAGAVSEFNPDTHGYRLAERGTRFFGALIDGVIGLAVYFLAAFGVGVFGFYPLEDPQGPVILVMTMMVVMIPYFVVVGYLITTRGQSPGKILVNTKIVRKEDGGPIGFVRGVLIRLIGVQWLLGSVPGFALVDALVIFGEPRRCIHDYMAGSIVISTRPVRKVRGREHQSGAVPPPMSE